MAEQTSVKIPTFHGQEKNFSMFWMRFKAYAGVKGFVAAIQIGGETDMPMAEDDALDPVLPEEDACSNSAASFK